MIKYYANTTPITCPVQVQFVGDQVVDENVAHGEYVGKLADGTFISAQEVSYHSIWGQTGRICLLGQHPARAS
jgi:hypothetical protein